MDVRITSVSGSFLARFAGSCGRCGHRFGVGTVVAYVNPVYPHPVCGPCASYARQRLQDGGIITVVGRPDGCAAVTKAGRPCRNPAGPDGLCPTHRQSLPPNVVSLAARRHRKAV